MATTVTIGHGSSFAVGVGAPPTVTYVAFAELTSITGPALQRDVVDATHMASPEKWREHIGGLRDAGEISLTMNFIPGSTDQDGVFNVFAADVVQYYQITFPNEAAWEFAAWCTGYDTDTPLDDKMTATATFKLTGKPAFFVLTP